MKSAAVWLLPLLGQVYSQLEHIPTHQVASNDITGGNLHILDRGVIPSPSGTSATNSTSTSTSVTSQTITSTAINILSLVSDIVPPVVVNTSSSAIVPTPTPGTCDSTYFDYSPTLISGVLNSTFQVSIAPTNKDSKLKKYAQAYYNGIWEFGCFGQNASVFPMDNKTLVYFNSSSAAKTTTFAASSNPFTCYLNIYVQCGKPVPSKYNYGALGITIQIPSTTLSQPVTSSSALISSLASLTSSVLKNDSTTQEDKMQTISNLASNYQIISTANSTANMSSVSDDLLSAMQLIVNTTTPSDLVALAPKLISSVKSLCGKGSSSSKAERNQGAVVLAGVLTTIVQTNSTPSFTAANGQDVIEIIAQMIKDTATSRNNSILATVELLSKIAASQASLLTGSVSYADDSGLISVLATNSTKGSLASVINGNNGITVGKAFNTLLAGLSTNTVTSRAISLATNPFNATTPDAGNR